MRISSTLLFQTGLNSINSQQADLMHLYQQVGSGKRMVSPSDDPLGAAQAINIRQSQSLNKRFEANREVLNRNLGAEDNALSSSILLMQDMKTELIRAGNGTFSDANRATLSDTLKNARAALLGLANSTDGSGQYLFSGAKGGTAAFQDVNGKIVYMGDEGQRKIQADQTRQIAGSDVGSDIFNRAAPGTTSYLTRAEDPFTGTGLMSTPTITDPNGPNIGSTFTVAFSATMPNEYTISVEDPSGNIITGAPQTYIPGSSDTLDLGGGVQVKLTGAPGLGDTFVVEPANAPEYVATAGAGNTSDATIASPTVSDYSIVDPTAQYEINFTDADTYTVSINGASDGTEYDYVPGRENTLQLPGGMQVKISGSPAAGDTFEIQASATTTDLNIFDTLDSMIAALENPLDGDPVAAARFQNTLASAMQRLDVNYNNITTVQASVGARMNEVDGINANGTLRNLSYSNQLTSLENLDYYSGMSELKMREAALQAAALAFQTIQRTSLFNMGNN